MTKECRVRSFAKRCMSIGCFKYSYIARNSELGNATET